ncbi:S-adenosyl-L-methionine-dependent methyltransferase [Dunaliella salina]|uniref:S-adenosyl-L-methionine-dependent methyltransferase n=1 Tax=Dunaliella salina TaxID=3046 RepID=A0ABQ7GQI9_DUNSA|nr:S-adenosyl-L-methionine-dependent methyltransferase [Dunaliella salina]|eukprot:KAF5836875.1 S-adenosyl-L-methionine-dependent methyltransferase [Dunaliella salina]
MPLLGLQPQSRSSDFHIRKLTAKGLCGFLLLKKKSTGAESSSTSSSSTTEAYFRQYDNPNSHMPLLRDSVLTRTWQLALEQLGPEHIRGKVVLDVGCGPGHLAMMCAQAGAEHVIAVDGSAAIAEVARQVKKADVLVSNFAGPGLLAGGMMRAIARARRDLLKPGGLVLPSRAELFVSGIEDREALAAAKAAWDVPVAGLTLAPAMMQVVRHPRVETLQRASQVATSTCNLLQLSTAAVGVLHFDLGFCCPSSSQSGPNEQAASSSLNGGNQEEVAVFTSDPRAPPTHYQQLVLSFPRAVRVAKGDVLEGKMSLQPSGTKGSDVEISVELTFQGSTATTSYMLVHSACGQTLL